MMVRINNSIYEDNVTISIKLSAMKGVVDRTHIWLIDSAASSHLCSNIDLFETIEHMSPTSIETASGESFIADKTGTVNITLQSDPSTQIPDLPITLQEVLGNS